MTTSNHDRLRRVFADVLGVPVNAIDMDTSPQTVASWDSMAHIDLVLALEAEFAVSLSAEDSLAMTSVADARSVLSNHGVSFDGAAPAR